MTLMLHVNAKPVEYGELRELETPEATATHVPLPHFRLVDLVKTTVGMYGHEVIAEHHGITEDGMRYFGLLSLKSPYTGYEDTVVHILEMNGDSYRLKQSKQRQHRT